VSLGQTTISAANPNNIDPFTQAEIDVNTAITTNNPEAITVQDFFIFGSVTAVIVFLFWRHKKK
jgi:hypothetical protein